MYKALLYKAVVSKLEEDTYKSPAILVQEVEVPSIPYATMDNPFRIVKGQHMYSIVEAQWDADEGLIYLIEKDHLVVRRDNDDPITFESSVEEFTKDGKWIRIEEMFPSA